MDVRLNPRLQSEIHNSAHTERLLAQAAARFVSELAGVTPKDTGETAASTRIETGHRSADGKSVAVRVVQSGASVPQQFGNSRENTPARHFDRLG